MSEQYKPKTKRYWLYFFVVFIAVSIGLLFGLVMIEKKSRQMRLSELKFNEQRVIQLENQFIGKEVQFILSDLRYLREAYQSFLIDGNHLDKAKENWRIFSTQRKIYDQIRYLDEEGNEKIRINLIHQEGQIVPDEKLQNKKSRYYFYEAAALPEGNIHISPLDLNIEHQKVEEPYKPMIRFSCPIYDENGAFQGVIVLNYLAQHLLEEFRALSQNSMGEVILLNEAGYWLSCSEKEKEWTFMFEDKKHDSFASMYPTQWESIQTGQGQYIAPQGLITFSEFQLEDRLKEDKNRVFLKNDRWFMVSTVYKNERNHGLFLENNMALTLDVLKHNILYLFFVLVLSLATGVIVFLKKKSYEEIKYHSAYDGLTKAYNRRAGIKRLDGELSKGNPVSLCFIDINGLKQVNDILGHQFGDELIMTVVTEIKSILSGKDFVARLGGDEFLIGFVGVSLDSAEKVWAQIVARYEEINETESRDYIISVSHGMVHYGRSQREEIDFLLKEADEKMYEEKKVLKKELNVIRHQNEHYGKKTGRL